MYALWDRQRFQRKGGASRVGFYVKAGKDPKVIKRMWIWGERNSCTTLVTDILFRNFAPNLSCKDKPCVKGGMPWKHAFMREADLSEQETTLHILVTPMPRAHGICLPL